MGPGTGTASNLTNAGTNSGAGADITKGTHADNACSIVAYTGEKFYEYVAIAKMVYVLATDENARKQLMSGISESGFGHLMSGYGYSEMAQSNFQLSAVEQILSWFGLGDKDKAEKYAKDGINMQLMSQSEYSKAADAIAGYFNETWNAIKKRFTQCGWLYGIATLTVDGVFLVGDLALGEGISAGAKAMLKSLKVFVRVVKTGEEVGRASKVVVEFTHASGGKVEREFTVEQLEREFGKPEDHHPGVKTEDANHNPSPEGSKAEPQNAKDGQHGDGTVDKPTSGKLVRGKNDNEIAYDPTSGRPISAKGTLREDFGASTRGDNATAIGKLGDPGDHGGHLVAHRFMGDTPDYGIVPQAGNLNTGAWKTMENEWADWVNKGYEVDYDIGVNPPGAVRPNSFDVEYTIRDPKTGAVKYSNEKRFKNEAGQSFNRVRFRDME